MKPSDSTSPTGATQTRGRNEPRARVQPLPSGRFRVVVWLGPHPITGKPIRLSRTFATEHEALTFQETMLADGHDFRAHLQRRLEVAALPSPAGYPAQRIYLVRGRRVMLDADVAKLFGTRTGWLNQAVSRNLDRFPEDFAFRLTPDEVAGLRTLGAIKPPGQGGRRALPRVFTDFGLVMVGAILKSSTAVKLNIEVVRAVCAINRMPEPPEDE